MDPYLERHWEDVHTILMAYARDAIQPQLAEDLVARVEERIYIDGGGVPIPHSKPDVRIVEDPLPWEVRHSSPAGVALDEPVMLDLESEPLTERSIHIMDIEGNRIVTAIEILSPWNKLSGAVRAAYLQKRQEYLASESNLVEIDLVRAGNWLTMVTPYHVPEPYRTTYRVCVKRAIPGAKGELYPISLRQKLPTIRIPLRRGEPDVTLGLQSLIDQVYRNGRYHRIDYSKPCDPPLQGEDAEWAAELLKAHRSKAS
jgi:hypothetical protein